MKNFIKILFLFLLINSFSSCKKEDDFNKDSSVKLFFSEDTILFDTIFVTIGSTTQYLTVYNHESKPIKISSIRLAKGNSSSYRMNVDGVPGRSVNDIEIGPKDSLFIFIEVTIDPSLLTTPFLVTDSILFETNGNLQDVDLVAFGQNAHFFTPQHSYYGLPYSVIGGDLPPCGSVFEWDSILPYVIYGYAVVDSCTTLKIKEGTKIYFYQNSGLWVYRGGKLKAKGSYEHPIIFQGTRLEDGYAKIPGQWDRIWINEGFDPDSNEIDYAIIKNGFIGLQPEDLPPVIGENQRKLKLTNTIIKNMSGFGILARDYAVYGFNNVIANCGQYNAAFTYGGDYNFIHCTFANCSSQGQRSTPAVYINNFYTDQTGDVTVPLKASFTNSIIWGNIDNELQLDFISSSDTAHYFFGNCLLKADTSVHTSDQSHFLNILLNQDPKFTSCTDNDYTLDAGSPAIDYGDANFTGTFFSLDLAGKPRIVGNKPDLGAYEKQ